MREPMLRISRNTVFWIIISVGLSLPWLTGIGVKLYLDAHGSPTMQWSSFLGFSSLVFEIFASIWWGVGYIVLAFLARRLLSTSPLGLELFKLPIVVILLVVGLANIVLGRLYEGFALIVLSYPAYRILPLPYMGLHSYQARILFIFCGFVGGAIGTVRTFIAAWANVEYIFYGFVAFPITSLVYMAGGLLVGYVLGKSTSASPKEESGT